MEKSEDLDEEESDEKCDERPAKKQLSGLVVPYMQTKQGKLNIGY